MTGIGRYARYPRAVRASRLVNLLLLLQSRGGLTAAELARELEVSVRTIHRDVEELSAAGVPIFAERGPHGGIRLVDGYRTRLTGMTADEAEALFLAGLPGPAAQLGLGTVVAAAQLKVMAALPPELRSAGVPARRAVPPRRRPAGSRPTSRSRTSPTLSAAVWDGRQVAIDYDRGPTGRRPDHRPRSGSCSRAASGTWSRPIDGQIRTYRVSRVLGAAVAGGAGRPAGPRSTSPRTGRSRARRTSGRARPFGCACGSARSVFRACGRWSAIAWSMRPSGSTSPIPTAGRTCGCELPWPDEVAALLLGVGSGLEVLDPPEIREQLVATAARVLERYGVVGSDVDGRAAVGRVAPRDDGA